VDGFLRRILEVRDWLLTASQYRGYEWVELFLGVVFLWVVFRTGLFGAQYGPKRVTGMDATIGVLTAIVAFSILGSQL